MTEQYNSQTFTSRGAEERIAQLRFHEHAVVVGSAATVLALPDARPAADIDLSVSQNVFRDLRATDGWQEASTPDGHPRLTNGIYDVSVAWGGTAHEALAQRAWQTPSGIAVAGLSDIYAIKQQTDRPKDRADTAEIRRLLEDPNRLPMPERVLASIIEEVRATLPKNLQHAEHAQRAIKLAANGVFNVFVKYGDPDVGRANQIIGAAEPPEFGVPATYHNGFGLLEDMRELQEHLTNINATDEERLLAMIAEAYSDAIYGNGRKKTNPNTHDELLSARLAKAHALMAGFSERQAQRIYNIDYGTTFDEETYKQIGRDSPDKLVRAGAGIDLQVLSRPDSPKETISLALEDHMSARFDKRRIIGKVATTHRVRIASTDQGLLFVDAYANERPEGGDMTVIQAFATRVDGNANFHDPNTGYQPPHDWTLENREMRLEHVAFLREISRRMLSTGGDKITAVQAYELAELHKQAVIARFKP